MKYSKIWWYNIMLKYISYPCFGCHFKWEVFEFLSLKKSLNLQVVCVRESTKPILCSKWGHFDKAKTIFKILLASWTFYIIEKGLRSFDAENLRSVAQRTAELLAIKLCTCTLFGLYGWRVCNRLWPRFENAWGLIILKV